MNTLPTQAPDLICPDCGYDLRGIDASARCPECGSTIDRAALAASQLPWNYRDSIGWFGAYWRTVWTSTWRIKRLAMEVVRPIDPIAARRFSLITALIAGMPLAVLIVIAMIVEGSTSFLNPFSDAPANAWSAAISEMPAADVALPFAAGITLAPVLPLGIMLSAWLIARAGAIWFGRGAVHRKQQERAATLSAYAMAPLAWLPVGIIILFAGNVLLNQMTTMSGGSSIWFLTLMLVICAGIGIPIFAVFICWLNTLRLLRRTVHPTSLRLMLVAAMLPATWLACLLIALGAMPWVVGLLSLMIDSLRP